MFAAYIIRAKMGEVFGGDGVPSGMTIGKAIEEQIKWKAERDAKEAEQRALKEKIERERADLRKQIDDAVTVAVVGLKVKGKDWQSGTFSDQQIIKLAINNKEPKDIAGVRGRIRFVDIFDKDVGDINFSYDDGVRAGDTANWTGVRDINEFIAEHRAIARLEEGKYRAIFEPNMVVYSDGTKLKMPEQ